MKTILLLILSSMTLVAQVSPEKVKATQLTNQAAVLVQWQIRGNRQPVAFDVQRRINGVRDETFRVQAFTLQQQEFKPDITAYFWTDTNNIAIPGSYTPWVYTYKVKAFNKEGKGSAWGKLP